MINKYEDYIFNFFILNFRSFMEENKDSGEFIFKMSIRDGDVYKVSCTSQKEFDADSICSLSKTSKTSEL